MSIRIFKDDQMQALFDKQGFLTVQFINEAEVKQLNDLFDQLHPSLPLQGFVSGSYSADFEYKKRDGFLFKKKKRCMDRSLLFIQSFLW